MYDETPMPVRLRDRIEELRNEEMFRGFQQSSLWNWSDGVIRFSESGPAKLFQVESVWGALASIEDQGAVRFIMFTGKALSNLQVFDRVTGETTRQGLRQIWTTSHMCTEYGQRTRGSVTDRGAANGAAERGIRCDNLGWQHLHLDCRAHLAALVFGKACSACEWLVTGMIRTALATHMAGSMSHFRRCLKLQIRSMVQFTTGEPPTEYGLHVRRVVAMYGRSGHNLVQRLVVLRMLPNGDWTDKARIVIYAPALPRDDAQAKLWTDRIVAGLCFAVCPPAFKKFSRNRWFGKEVSLDQIGLLEHCHGLFSSTFRRWVSEVDGDQKRKRTAAASAGPFAAPGVPGDQPVLALCDAPGDAFADPGADGAGDGGPPLGHEDAQPQRPDDAERVVVEVNAHEARERVNSEHRRRAMVFASTEFLHHLDVMRIVMVPIMEMFREFDFLGGDAWEERQRAVEAEALRLGVGAEAAQARRTYRIVVCAKGSVEQTFFNKLKFLYNSSIMWRTIEGKHCTELINAYVFKTMSRAGAKAECEIAALHRRYPYRAFLLISDPTIADEMIREPDCIADPFWREFRNANPDLKSPSTRARLVLLALLRVPSIVRIEVRDFHALAAQYRAITDEEREYFRRLGAEGTQKHSETPNGRSFGPTVRDVERAAARSQKHDMCEALLRDIQRDELQRDASLAIADSVVARSRSWQDGEHLAKMAKKTLSEHT
ncbi:unnamed protein product, partial [Prorocentrum cordatum]